LKDILKMISVNGTTIIIISKMALTDWSRPCTVIRPRIGNTSRRSTLKRFN
jgi:hypothetical protein